MAKRRGAQGRHFDRRIGRWRDVLGRFRKAPVKRRRKVKPRKAKPRKAAPAKPRKAKPRKVVVVKPRKVKPRKAAPAKPRKVKPRKAAPAKPRKAAPAKPCKAAPAKPRKGVTIKRRRDALGRFVKALPPRRKVKPRKTAPVTVKPRKLKPPVKRLPSYINQPVAGTPSQRKISGISRWSVHTLASLLLRQLKSGYLRFRFWYKVKELGYGSAGMIRHNSLIGSTFPMLWDILAHRGDPPIFTDQDLPAIIAFLNGRNGHILGRVIYYWASKGTGYKSGLKF